MSSAVNWFEIPVRDLDRATRFYASVLGADLRREEMAGTSMALFPYTEGGVGGALVVGEKFVPSKDGVVVYLNAGDDLDGVLARIPQHGGQVVLDKTRLPGEIGSIAQFLDTEGNRVAFHSRN